MKRLLAVMLLFAVLAAGCGTEKSGAVPFEAVPVADLPREVRDWVTTATKDQNNAINAMMTFSGKTYLLVYGGMLPSRGYTVTFHKVEHTGGKLAVTATIDGPSRPWFSTMEAPVGVARIEKFDGKASFDVTRKPVPPETVRKIQTGPVTVDLNQIQEIQTQVDNGHQPWRLDPLQVAMEEGRRFGFDPAAGDRFELVARAGAEATVEVKVGTAAYLVQLKQPLGTRLGSIWTIVGVEVR
ncbi:MAG TPA: hypothetical protein VNT75_11875 [Symbiobacteriaceae bacterium]|nr:hypothetical protein [Symbiobacteriaceae bacterium]